MQLAVSISLLLYFVTSAVCDTEEANSSFPRVITPLGRIEGYYKTSYSGRQFEAYEGIPYAQPPIGELRFQVPKSVLPWSGIIMAKGYKPVCMQYSGVPEDPTKRVTGAEDCLHLNIYTLIRDDSDKVNGIPSDLLPVIFFLHDGLFQRDSGSNYGPKYLMDRDVTLVTLDYRVGPLGFLSTEDGIVPGNMGLKDQVVALRWVKKNIESFGGDPSSVTVFGQSAGGSSTQYHLMSKQSIGLFHRGMLISGCALNSFAEGKGSLGKAKKLANVVGCPTNDIRKMVDCMRSRPARQIVDSEKEFLLNKTWLIGPPAPFGPVVEKGGGDFTFLDRSPSEALKSGKIRDIPLIMGVVAQEGLAVTGAFVGNATRLKEFDDLWETIAPYVLDYNYTVPESRYKKIARLVKSHYLGSKKFDESTVNQTIKLFSDRLIVYPLGEAAMLQARATKNPVRFYIFSYRGAHSLTEGSSGSKRNFGVTHIDDLAYVLEYRIDTASTPKDRAMQKRMIELWVSFAKYGIPKVAGTEWSRMKRGGKKLNYLHIAGPDKMGMETTRNLGDRFFWESLGLRENNNKFIRIPFISQDQ